SLVVIEIPGFGRRRLGAVFFLAAGAAIGALVGPRASAFLALQLSSPASAASICSRLARRPAVVLSSTSGMLSEASLLRHGRGGRLRRALLGRQTVIVAQTEQAADELREVGGPRVAVLPNPVGPVSSPPLNGQPRAVFAGRLSAEKDLPTLLRAWASLTEQRGDGLLTLLGSGGFHRSVEPALRDQVARDPRLSTTVRFAGWIDEPAREIGQADVFVLPSLSEGMSNGVLEAAALGRILVVSDIAANVSVVGEDYPLLFPAGDASALRDCLRTAFSDDDVRARCRAQLARRITCFSVSTICEQLELLLLDANRPRDQ
ncbi:MAG TPA: glycosyltransferase family 4 protein, partial [Solirubrobacteraceae bacterium]|nr:glycosyltransferase family 4 protein [Solirubrobacteraceae bacterium]